MALAADNAEIYINSEESISPDEIRPLLEAQHSTFDPITISWSQEIIAKFSESENKLFKRP